MFSRRTISLFVLAALMFGTWTVGGLVFGQETPSKESEVSEKPYPVQARDRRYEGTYPISGADMRTVVNVLASVAPNTEIAVNSEGDQLRAVGPKADHEKIRETLEKLVPKKPVAAESSAGNSTSMGRVSPSIRWYTTRSIVADPQMVQLVQADLKMEEEAKELVVRYRFAAGEKEQGLARTKLEELTSQHFDVRQERRGLELSRLEQRLERVRASLEKRSEARQLIVDRHIAQLLGEGDDLAF